MNGPQPISVSDVMAFCALAGIAEAQDRMMILYGVQAMDNEFRKVIAEKQKQEAKKK